MLIMMVGCNNLSTWDFFSFFPLFIVHQLESNGLFLLNFLHVEFCQVMQIVVHRFFT